MTPELLDFEEQRPRWSGQKDEAIRARFGVPPARYFQLLERAIDTRAALEARPMLVRWLLRQRDAVGREVARRYRAV
jgi:hypothetical protein